MKIHVTSGARRLAISLAAIALTVAGIAGASRMFVLHARTSETSRAAKPDPSRFKPTAAQWASLSVETVTERIFRAEHITEGKIALNEASLKPRSFPLMPAGY